MHVYLFIKNGHLTRCPIKKSSWVRCIVVATFSWRRLICYWRAQVDMWARVRMWDRVGTWIWVRVLAGVRMRTTVETRAMIRVGVTAYMCIRRTCRRMGMRLRTRRLEAERICSRCGVAPSVCWRCAGRIIVVIIVGIVSRRRREAMVQPNILAHMQHLAPVQCVELEIMTRWVTTPLYILSPIT